MGKFDSSLTRVRPVFQTLIKQDPTGATWLPGLLSSPDRASGIPAEIRANPGHITEFALEREIEPPTAFLNWLLKNPQKLTWPMTANKRRTFGKATTQARTSLIDGAGTPTGEQAKTEGLAALQGAGAGGSRRKWWAFEGFTHVDAFIATPKIVLLVEGKRTDALSPATDWYPSRNQLARNIEAAGTVANGRVGMVMLALEKPILTLDMELIRASLPHLDEQAQDAALARFIGQATWASICQATGIDHAALPDKVSE